MALGGDTWSDLAVVRTEPAEFGQVASDRTVSLTVETLARGVERVQPAIDRSRATARALVWAASGANAPDHET